MRSATLIDSSIHHCERSARGGVRRGVHRHEVRARKRPIATSNVENPPKKLTEFTARQAISTYIAVRADNVRESRSPCT